jgi:hypothetical protein
MLGSFALLIIAGLSWNACVSYEKQTLRDEYHREMISRRETRERQRSEMMASCDDTLVHVPLGFKPPTGIALMLACPHNLHEPRVIEVSPGQNIVQCRCSKDRLP